MSLRSRFVAVHPLALAVAIIGPAIDVLSASAFAASPVPKPDHVVVVVMENHSFAEIVDGRKAP